MLDSKLQLYFPQMVQQVGWLMILFAILGLVQAIPLPNPIVPGFCILFGVILSLTFAGSRLDLTGRRIKRYVGLFGIKIGGWEKLPELNEIVLTSGSYSQQIHAWVSRSQVNTRVFRAFLKGPDSKILFSTGKDPQSVRDDVQKAAEQLNLPAIDYTVRPPAKIVKQNG